LFKDKATMNTFSSYIAKKYAVAYAFCRGEDIDEKKKIFDSIINEIDKNMFYFSNPTIPFDVKREILEKILYMYKNKSINKILLMMIKNKRIKLIREVYKKFSRIYLDLKNMIEVDVVSRYDLNENQKQMISSLFFKLTTKKPQIRILKDENVIGGFIIKWDDKVIDASINKKLALLKENLIKEESL